METESGGSYKSCTGERWSGRGRGCDKYDGIYRKIKEAKKKKEWRTHFQLFF